MDTYYKTLTDDHRGGYWEFDYSAYLPGGDHAGEWLPDIDYLDFGNDGYPVADASGLVYQLNAEIWFVDVRGKSLHRDHESIYQSIRFVRKLETWNEKTKLLFCCWCMRQVWHTLTDERSKYAVDTAEKIANGETSEEEFYAEEIPLFLAVPWYVSAWAAQIATNEVEARELQTNYLLAMLDIEHDTQE